mmetsp:Transcript_126155/g.218627  ORF Transcript_126155/g.218627 Transcript_126155/m.218627 type:complete len:210 (+) Transcript_126155:28-657(+)
MSAFIMHVQDCIAMRSRFQKRSMTKSPTSSAASTTNSPASTAKSPIASPAASSPSPAASTVASTPCSAMCSPRTTPPTARPPTTATPAAPAATLAPVLQPPPPASGAAAGSAPGVSATAAGGLDGPSGTGTSIACPTLAVAGTFTAMNSPFLPGYGTWMVVPGAPGGTLITVVFPGGTRGLDGGFHLNGGRISRSFLECLLICFMSLKS